MKLAANKIIKTSTPLLCRRENTVAHSATDKLHLTDVVKI
jgi:hypothetical protein